MSALVEVHGLSKRFRGNGGQLLTALDGLNLSIEQQAFLCILGPSGCGKSTFLNLLAGLDTIEEGDVTLGGLPLAQALGKARIAYVFQEPRLLPWLTVRGNLRLVLRATDIPAARHEALVTENLERVGLGGFADSYPHQLSGGMQQRASIARALCIEPDLLLMDEPFSALDEITARRMRLELLQLWEQTRKTVIFVTHNAFEACYLADRIILMSPRPGRIHRELTVPLPRPRRFDDPELFQFSSGVVSEFLRLIGEE